MRHRKVHSKLERPSSHRRCLIANMLKALVEHGTLKTTVTKAKEVKRHADRLITLAKKNTLSSRRAAMSRLMISFNSLTSKEKKQVKQGNTSSYNSDRKLIDKLFNELSTRYVARDGGYTRIIRTEFRQGDHAPLCILEFIQIAEAQSANS